MAVKYPFFFLFTIARLNFKKTYRKVLKFVIKSWVRSSSKFSPCSSFNFLLTKNLWDFMYFSILMYSDNGLISWADPIYHEAYNSLLLLSSWVCISTICCSKTTLWFWSGLLLGDDGEVTPLLRWMSVFVNLGDTFVDGDTIGVLLYY